jgi:hypothetical protein
LRSFLINLPNHLAIGFLSVSLFSISCCIVVYAFSNHSAASGRLSWLIAFVTLFGDVVGC